MTVPTGNAASPLDGRLIFVVGARRSGTNWLQRVLETHPDVVGTRGESFLFSRGLVPLVGRFHHGSPDSVEVGWVYADRDRLHHALRSFCDVVFGDLLAVLGPADRLIDRTPEHVTCLDLIGSVYPDAYVIHIIRDGRDVVRSLLSMRWGPAEAELAAEEWRAAVVDGRRQGAGLPRYREVRYEALLADPARQIGELLGWLGLAATPPIIEAALLEAGRAFTVDPKMPTIAAGKWREGLAPEALAILRRVAGEALVELGYEGDGSPPSGPLPEPAQPEGAPTGAPAAGGTRSLLSKAIGRVRHRLSPSSPGDDSELRQRLHASSRVVSRFLSDITAGSRDRAAAGLVDDVRFDLDGVDELYDGRGDAARERMLDTFASDEVLRWPQVRSHVLAGVPTTTVVTRYRGPAGEVETRVLAVTVDRHQGISRVSYHQITAGGS